MTKEPKSSFKLRIITYCCQNKSTLFPLKPGSNVITIPSCAPSACTDGTLHWQAPKLMQGAQVSTPDMDVYVFYIFCVESLTMVHGSLPLVDDDVVWHYVLSG
ncbi:hypothetical protein EI94DRAFT_1700302 [Lactarius quietus]|nr:hypothetical protein EI94DRAFT_1700302 [Lactarius quietus]